MFHFGGGWSFVWGAKLPKAPLWRRDWNEVERTRATNDSF